MDLGKYVEDKGLLDRNGRLAGKADDLLLEIPEGMEEGSLPRPEVTAILSGPLALAQNLPAPLYALARVIYRLLGIADPRPVEIPWERITAIDAAVHVDIDREESGLIPLSEAVARRIIRRLPGSGYRP